MPSALMRLYAPKRNKIIKETLILTNRRCRQVASPTDRRGRFRRRDSHRAYIPCARQSRPDPSCPLTYFAAERIIESNVYTYFAQLPSIRTLENKRARLEKKGSYPRRDDDSL